MILHGTAPAAPRRARVLLHVELLLAASIACAGCNLFVDPDTRVARAQERLDAGDLQSAVIQLREALEERPEHGRARFMLAGIAFRQGDVATAEKELRRATQAGIPAAETAELAAGIKLALGQSKDLLIQIEAGELPLPPAKLAMYRGHALLAQRQADAAIEAFNAALSADASLSLARTGLAEALATKGRAAEALQALEAVLGNDPGNAAALLVRGKIQMQAGKLAEADKSLTAAQQSAATLDAMQRVQLLSMITETRLARGDIAGARQSQEQLAAIASDALITRVLAARVAMAMQDYSAASTELQRVVTAVPDVPSARFLLGAALLAQGNLYQAESHLARVVQEAPENLEARKLLAQARLRLQQPDAAMQVLLPAQQQEATDPQVNQLLGMARLQLGDVSGAIGYLERSAASRPGDRQAQLELAATYIRAGDSRKAQTLLRSIAHDADDARREALMIAAAATTDGAAGATQLANELLRTYPGNVPLLNVCSVLFAQRGEFDRARALLAEAIAKEPKNASTVLNAARVELAAGNENVAVTQLESVLAFDPGNKMALLGLAELAMRRGQTAAAINWLEEARKRDAQALEPRLALAKLYLRDKRTKEADQLIAEVAAKGQQRPEVINAIGLLYLDAGRYDEAISRFDAATDLDPRNAGYWLNLARSQLAIDRRGIARESLERARAAAPDSIAVVGALVLLDVRDGKADAAAARVAELRKQRPKDPNVLVLEGDLRMTLRQYAEADAAYGKARALRADSAVVLKAYRARSLGKLDSLVEPLTDWLDQHPDDFTIQAVLAEAYQRTGRRERAIEAYELIAQNGPANAAVLNNLAWLYYLNRDVRAEAIALRAHRLAPTATAVADTYGWILVENGKVAEGLPILERAAAGPGAEPDILFHYAAALARSGDVGGARQRLADLLQAHVSFPSHTDAQKLLRELSK